jgi:hypothetical protein
MALKTWGREARLREATSAESWMRWRRSQGALERSRIWKKAAVSQYAGTGAMTVRSESEREGRREGAGE